ncbi:MAG: hypothetical protein K0S41_812 [Anaerocolumna sp.]|jgi:hypothetical protein|nr:hypothetical protein [Anaerocolumna sp.]
MENEIKGMSNECMRYEKPTATIQKTSINAGEDAYSAAAAPVGAAAVTAGAGIIGTIYTKHCW